MTDNVTPIKPNHPSYSTSGKGDWLSTANQLRADVEEQPKRTAEQIIEDMKNPRARQEDEDHLEHLRQTYHEPAEVPDVEPQGHEVDPFATDRRVIHTSSPIDPDTPIERLFTDERRYRAKVLGEWQEGDETNRAKRYSADTRMVLGILLGLVGLLAAASFAVSFSGLYAAAEWAVGPVPALQIAVPIMLDLAIISFTLALFVERERREKVVGTIVAIGLFAAVSSASNVLHTLSVTTAVTLPQLIAGAVISGGAPLLLAFATDKIAVKVFKAAS